MVCWINSQTMLIALEAELRRETKIWTQRQLYLSWLIGFCEITEPPMTCSLSTTDLKDTYDEPMKFPKWLKQELMFIHKRREGYILGLRWLEEEKGLQIPVKQDLFNLVRFNIYFFATNWCLFVKKEIMQPLAIYL